MLEFVDIYLKKNVDIYFNKHLKKKKHGFFFPLYFIIIRDSA